MTKTQLLLTLTAAVAMTAVVGCGSKDPDENMKPVLNKPGFKGVEGTSQGGAGGTGGAGGGTAQQRPGAGAPPPGP